MNYRELCECLKEVRPPQDHTGSWHYLTTDWYSWVCSWVLMTAFPYMNGIRLVSVVPVQDRA